MNWIVIFVSLVFFNPGQIVSAQDKDKLLSALEAEQFHLAKALVEGGQVIKSQHVLTTLKGRRQRDGDEEQGNRQRAQLLDLFYRTNSSLSPNLQDPSGWTPLMLFLAAGGEEEQSVQMIIEREGFNPNLQNENGWTAAMFAAIFNRPISLLATIKHPLFDPNIQNRYGLTAAMFAALFIQDYSHLKTIFQLQVEKGALLEKLRMTHSIDASISGLNALEILEVKRGRVGAKLARQVRNVMRWDIDEDCLMEFEVNNPHLVQEEFDCAVCFDRVTEGVKCGCGQSESEEEASILCLGCHRDQFDHFLNHSAIKIPSCSHCKNPYPSSYFVANMSEDPLVVLEFEEIIKLAKMMHQKRISDLKNNVFCKTPDCPGFTTVGDLQEKFFDCPYCQKSTRVIGPKVVDDGGISAAQKLIEKTCKNCPKCHRTYDKSGGCQHMTCSCGHEFMWKTGQDFRNNCPHCQAPNTLDSWAKKRVVQVDCVRCGEAFEWKSQDSH